MNTKQITEEMETEKIPEWYSSLSKIQKACLISLKKSGLEGGALIGFFLLLKDDIPGMESLILLVEDLKPSKEELARLLTNYIQER